MSQRKVQDLIGAIHLGASLIMASAIPCHGWGWGWGWGMGAIIEQRYARNSLKLTL